MNADEIFEIAETFVNLGVKKIRLTGGEPLVRRDVDEIMHRLSSLPIELTLTTNALLVDRHIDVFKKTGIRSLNVSLDTLKEHRFKEITKREGFRKTLSNISLLLENGFRVKVNVVAMKNFNEDEILSFIEWTTREKVHVRFIEFMPFAGNNWQWERILSYRDILDMVEEKYEIIKLKDEEHDTAKAYQVEDAPGTFAIISSMTNHFCGTCNRLRLTANGKLKNCLFSNEEVDLLTAFRNKKDIVPLIKNSISKKYFKHGGIAELEKLNPSSPGFSERSMILIGG